VHLATEPIVKIINEKHEKPWNLEALDQLQVSKKKFSAFKSNCLAGYKCVLMSIVFKILSDF